METDILKKILDDRRELLSLPQTLAEVLRLVRDENSTADDLAGVLSKDPALTAKILRVVNSAYYGLSRKIASMKQAVMTIGHRQVTAIALSTSVYNLTSNWQTSFDRIRFWRHALEVAIASRMLAERAGIAAHEEAFVAGLLHDVGLLVLETAFPKEFSRVWKMSRTNGNLTDFEEEAWGTDHARVARFLLEQWRLPENVCQAVGSHHTVFMPGMDDPDLRLAQVVNLANRTARFTIHERVGGTERLNTEVIGAMLENLKISQDDYLAVQKNLFQKTIDEARFLEMDIGSSDDILMEANRILFQQYLDVESLLRENRKMQQQIVDDQHRRISFDSLRSAAGIFARYMDVAAVAMARKAEVVREEIHKGGPGDPGRALTESVESIIAGLESVYDMTTELRNLTTLDADAYDDESCLRAVEEKLRHQVDRINAVT